MANDVRSDPSKELLIPMSHTLCDDMTGIQVMRN